MPATHYSHKALFMPRFLLRGRISVKGWPLAFTQVRLFCGYSGFRKQRCAPRSIGVPTFVTASPAGGWF